LIVLEKSGFRAAFLSSLLTHLQSINAHTPHIHVRYQDEEAVIEIPSGLLIAGSIPPKQSKLVQAWIEIHADELMLDWQLAVNGDEPFRIAPLQ
jgi:hypothetical protein